MGFGLCKIESFQKSFQSVIMASQNVNPTVSSGMLDKDASDRSSATSSAQVSKRLQQELMSLMMSNDKGISAFPDGDKLFEWIATVNGPADSVYDGLKYKWSALYEVRTILLSIQSLLGEPNNDSPLNTQAATLWSNQGAYKRLLHEKYDAEAKKSSS